MRWANLPGVTRRKCCRSPDETTRSDRHPASWTETSAHLLPTGAGWPTSHAHLAQLPPPCCHHRRLHNEGTRLVKVSQPEHRARDPGLQMAVSRQRPRHVVAHTPTKAVNAPATTPPRPDRRGHLQFLASPLPDRQSLPGRVQAQLARSGHFKPCCTDQDHGCLPHPGHSTLRSCGGSVISVRCTRRVLSATLIHRCRTGY